MPTTLFEDPQGRRKQLGSCVELPHWADCPGDRPAFVGADLKPETLHAAFRAGFFPWPPATDHWRAWHAEQWGADLEAGRIRTVGSATDFALPWWAPDPRGVLFTGRARMSRRLRPYLRQAGWTATIDRATTAVIGRCGPGRAGESWISPEVAAAYHELAEAGIVHSLEIWSDDDLVGGLFGVLVGGVFSVESGFTAAPNAGHVATLDLAARLAEAGGVLIDVHMTSPHYAKHGAEDIPRERFHEVLTATADRPVELSPERKPVGSLVDFYLSRTSSSE